MLIKFSVGNYKSFKDVITFSMVAANLTSKNKDLDKDNIFRYKKSVNLVKTAAIYGANASGKSNFVKAFVFMRNFIINSSKETQVSEEINVENFQLSTTTENKPSFFEVIFDIENIRYRSLLQKSCELCPRFTKSSHSWRLKRKIINFQTNFLLKQYFIQFLDKNIH